MANPGSLDMVDRCLIALLQVDGRLSHTDISRRLALPEATVRRRLKRLLDEGIIQIVALPEPHKVGYGVHAIVGLRLTLIRLRLDLGVPLAHVWWRVDHCDVGR